MKVTTSDRLKELANLLGIKQSDMCIRTGIPKSSMSLYWNGQRVPKQNILTQIANTYNIQEAWLLGYDVPMERQQTPAPTFKPEHIKLITLYEKLSDEKKEALFTLLETM